VLPAGSDTPRHLLPSLTALSDVVGFSLAATCGVALDTAGLLVRLQLANPHFEIPFVQKKNGLKVYVPSSRFTQRPHFAGA
jgi:hypothetical protein